VNAHSKGAALAGMKSAGVFALARMLNRRRFRILAYHGVDPEADSPVNFDGFQVSPAVFRDQMDAVGRWFEVRPLGWILDRLTAGEPVGRDVLAITFDDGYRNNLTHAAPLLREYGFHATFFVTTGFVDGTRTPWWFRLRSQLVRSADAAAVAGIAAREEELKAFPADERELWVGDEGGAAYPLMSWEDVKKLIALGFDIGPHTVSHVSFTRETATRVDMEIRVSTARVREMTGRSPLCFSYPYGRSKDIGPDVIGLLQREGFAGAVTTVSGLNRRGENPFRLKRLSITNNHRGAAFEAALLGLTSVL
jgi:peptidoglycan/xylan/chitin deacetylase (PgdA/CDA1 family)